MKTLILLMATATILAACDDMAKHDDMMDKDMAMAEQSGDDMMADKKMADDMSGEMADMKDDMNDKAM